MNEKLRERLDLATDADLALYNELFKNDFVPIVITVMGFRARVEVSDFKKVSTGIGGIRLQRISDDSDAIEESKYVTDWLVSGEELWQRFLDGVAIEMYS